MRNSGIAALAALISTPLDGNYCALLQDQQSDSEDRRKPNRLDTKNSRHPIRQALQLFKLLACNVKFSLGGFKGGASLFEKRCPSLFRCRRYCGIFLRAKFCARAYDCATKRVRRGSGEKRKQNGGTRWRKRTCGARM